MSVVLTFSTEELKMLKLLFADGVSEAHQMSSASLYDAMLALNSRVDAMLPDTAEPFQAHEIDLLAKAVDLGRDKEESLVHDWRIAAELEAIDRVFAALISATSEKPLAQ